MVYATIDYTSVGDDSFDSGIIPNATLTTKVKVFFLKELRSKNIIIAENYKSMYGNSLFCPLFYVTI